MTQPEAIEKMMSGINVFLTGEPGAGKTYTLNQFIEQAQEQGKRIAITASTGIAALSRVRSLDGLYLIGLGPQALQMDRDIYQFDKALKQGRSS